MTNLTIPDPPTFGVCTWTFGDQPLAEITSIPESPEFIEGVINLRGEIIPIMDMRKRFGFKVNGDFSKENRIMVIETNGSLVGFIVDEVREVLRIPATDIEPTPELLSSDVDRRYIEGVATVDDQLLIALNSNLVIDLRDLTSILDTTQVAEV